MARLAVDIDPVAIIRNVLGGKSPDPAHMAVLVEMGGAESVVCFLRDDQKTVSERDVRVLREIVKSHLNVRSHLDENSVRNLLSLKPDMVTFVAAGTVSSLRPEPIQLDNYAAQLADFTADLRANDIAVSALVNPTPDSIKTAGKLELDYIELFAGNYTRARDLDEQIAELELINTLILAANRLGLGTNISGNLNHENIPELTNIQHLEDIIVGDALTTKALAIGFEHAVRDYIAIIQ
jgi:pyridoxine 5-phosphate synthase